MSLQYYDINLPINSSQEISAQGRYLRYLSGTTPNISNGNLSQSSQNQAIIVTSGVTGNSLVLMPGQSIRTSDDEKQPNSWRVRNYKNLETITGILLAGEGDFRDDNLITIVGNGATQPVPVNPQTGVYTSAYFNNSAGASSNGNVIFPANSNTNGAWIESLSVSAGLVTNGAQCEITFTAKTTPSINMYDGDVIMQTQIVSSGNNYSTINDRLPSRIFIPAGKGLFWNYSTIINVPLYLNKSVLYKLL